MKEHQVSAGSSLKSSGRHGSRSKPRGRAGCRIPRGRGRADAPRLSSVSSACDSLSVTPTVALRANMRDQIVGGREHGSGSRIECVGYPKWLSKRPSTSMVKSSGRLGIPLYLYAIENCPANRAPLSVASTVVDD